MSNKNLISVWVAFLVVSLNFSISEGWADPVLTIAVDLDQTLIDSVGDQIKEGDRVISYFSSEEVQEDNKTVIRAKTHYFRMCPEAPNFIQSLLTLPHVKLAFYSLGSENRNLAVLQLMKLPDGKTSFLEAAENRVLSKHPNDNHKKDLERLKSLIPEMDLEHTILIDDHLSICPVGQQKNILWLKQQHDGHRNRGPYFYDDARLTRAWEILKTVIATAHKKKISPVEALYDYQWIPHGFLPNPSELLTPAQTTCTSAGLNQYFFKNHPEMERKLIEESTPEITSPRQTVPSLSAESLKGSIPPSTLKRSISIPEGLSDLRIN